MKIYRTLEEAEKHTRETVMSTHDDWGNWAYREATWSSLRQAVSDSAPWLFDGGWNSNDREELLEIGFTPTEADLYIEWFKKFEEEKEEKKE